MTPGSDRPDSRARAWFAEHWSAVRYPPRFMFWHPWWNRSSSLRLTRRNPLFWLLVVFGEA